MYEYVRMSVL